MDQLRAADHVIFNLINHLPHTRFSDSLAQFVSGDGEAVLVWVVVGVLFLWKEERRHASFVFPFVSAGLSVWIFVENILKSLVARSRPTLEFGAIIVGSGADGYSFPSTHATLSFALAFICAQYEKRFAWVFYIFASIVSLSRVYLGVHFPVDVLVGALLGLATGKFMMWIVNAVQKRYTKVPQARDTRQKKQVNGASRRLKTSSR